MTRSKGEQSPPGSIGINRRQILGALASIGASVAVPISSAPERDIDREWDRLVAAPYVFEVDRHGTIREPDIDEVPTRGDLYQLTEADLSHTKAISSAADDCYGLRVMLDGWVAGKASEIQAAAMTKPAGSAARRRIMEIAADVTEGYEGVGQAWLEEQGEALVPEVVPVVYAWLGEEATYSDFEWAGLRAGTMGKALSFFEAIDEQVLRRLGVVTVEGEIPGSSYYAAELRSGVEEANSAAAEVRLPFRFAAAA